LLQRNGGREAVNGLHGRDGELVEKSTCVGRHGFEVAALRFGVKCSERKRGLAGAGNAGEDDERVAWNIDVDIAKIVLARAANTDDAVAVSYRFQTQSPLNARMQGTESWFLRRMRVSPSRNLVCSVSSSEGIEGYSTARRADFLDAGVLAGTRR
jgi:hypothetical protein